MKTVAEYGLYAEECRRLAAKTTRPKNLQELETLAPEWERVADEQEGQPVKQIDMH